MSDTDNMDDKNLLQEYNTSEIYSRKQVKKEREKYLAILVNKFLVRNFLIITFLFIYLFFFFCCTGPH